MPESSDQGQSAATTPVDPHACAHCNCHHHTTEQHENDEVRGYIDRLWGEDWDSDEDAVYDRT